MRADTVIRSFVTKVDSEWSTSSYFFTLEEIVLDIIVQHLKFILLVFESAFIRLDMPSCAAGTHSMMCCGIEAGELRAGVSTVNHVCVMVYTGGL